ncbi:MAG: DUF5658 family protein [Planctomycetota bacterium]
MSTTHTDASRRRSSRVIVLLAVVIALSLADLILTVQHLTSIGMAESNPIAAWVIRTSDSVAALSLYKLATVAIAVGSLFLVRRHRIAEVASWGAVTVLVALCFRWDAYAATIETDLIPMTHFEIAADQHWLTLDADRHAR